MHTLTRTHTHFVAFAFEALCRLCCNIHNSFQMWSSACAVPQYVLPFALSFSLYPTISLFLPLFPPLSSSPSLTHSISLLLSLCHFLSLLPCTILVSSSLTVCPIVVAAVAVIGMWQTLTRPPWPPQPLTSPRHPLLRLLLESLPQFY